MNTKFAVHCPPSVNVWVPGWIGAVSASAQVGAAWTGAVPPRTSAATLSTAVTRAIRSFMWSFRVVGPPPTPSFGERG